MNTYLATMGRDKVGFSVLDNDVQGMPVLVEGVRGIIERNAIRYYLAIQSYLDTLQVESDNRFNARISRWFELTESHPRQLHEMDKKEYVKYKQDEYADQQRLQKAIHDNGDQQQMCGTALSVNK